MKPLKISTPSRGGALEGADVGFIEVETSDGPYQIRFAAEDAARIAASFDLAALQIVNERNRLGLTPIQRALIKRIDHLEFAVDHLREVALLRTHFVDQSTQDTPVARDQIQPVIDFLSQTLRGFVNQSSGPSQ